MKLADIERILIGPLWQLVARWEDPQATRRIADVANSREDHELWGNLPIGFRLQFGSKGQLSVWDGSRPHAYHTTEATWQLLPATLPGAVALLEYAYNPAVYPAPFREHLFIAESTRLLLLQGNPGFYPDIYCEFGVVG